MKQILLGGEDAEEVNVKKRSSRFFRHFYLMINQLVIHEGLLLRVKFPSEGERILAAVILDEADAIRRLTQIHSQAHRQSIWVYTVFNIECYTPGAMQLAIKVYKSCHICSQMNYRKKLKVERSVVPYEKTCFFFDRKGPMGPRKLYVLVCVEATYRICYLSLMTRCDAKSVAKGPLSLMSVYGAGCHLVSDGGPENKNKINSALLALGSSAHSISNAYRPAAERCESLGIRPLAKMIRATMFNKPLDTIKEYLTYMMLVINSSTIHPLGRNPHQLLFG